MGGSTNRPSDNATTNQLLKEIAHSNAGYPSDDEIEVQLEMHQLLDLHFRAIQRQFNDLHLELVRDWNPELDIDDDEDIDEEEILRDLPRIWEMFMDALAHV